MEKKYVKIFKCRGCNRDIIKNDVDLSIAEKMDSFRNVSRWV